VAGGALAVGLPDGDVEAAVADGVVGALEAARIAQFGEDRRRCHRADTVEPAGECAAARLPARERLQRTVDRRQLTVELIEHAHAQLGDLASGGRQCERCELAPPGRGPRLQARRRALMEELRLQTLHPGGALIDQRLPR